MESVVKISDSSTEIGSIFPILLWSNDNVGNGYTADENDLHEWGWTNNLLLGPHHLYTCVLSHENAEHIVCISSCEGKKAAISRNESSNSGLLISCTHSDDTDSFLIILPEGKSLPRFCRAMIPYLCRTFEFNLGLYICGGRNLRIQLECTGLWIFIASHEKIWIGDLIGWCLC